MNDDNLFTVVPNPESYVVVNSDHTLKFKASTYSVDFKNMSWRYTLVSMAGYLLQPISMPIMILLSKVLKRKIEWFPVQMQ